MQNKAVKPQALKRVRQELDQHRKRIEKITEEAVRGSRRKPSGFFARVVTWFSRRRDRGAIHQ